MHCKQVLLAEKVLRFDSPVSFIISAVEAAVVGFFIVLIASLYRESYTPSSRLALICSEQNAKIYSLSSGPTKSRQELKMPLPT